MTDEQEHPSLSNDKDRMAFVRLRDTRQALQQSSHYSRRVGLLRWALPGLVLVVLGALIVWPMITGTKLSDVAADNVPNLMIENLHYTGLDADGQPYSVTARRALQVSGGKGLVDLEVPEAEITLKSGAWLVIKATSGRFDQNAKMLWLGGDVRFYHDQGYQVTTSEAQIDVGGFRGWGHQPILIQGPFGEVRGAGWRFLDRGQTLIIEGPATAHLVSLAQDLPQGRGSGKKADR